MKSPNLPVIFKFALGCIAISYHLIPRLHAANEQIAHSIESLTAVSSPEDRSRTKVGIGEKVKLTFVPGHNATWTISGPGKIDGGTDAVSGKNSVSFLAPDDAAEITTITATCDTSDGGKVTKTFETVVPTGMFFEKENQHISQKTPSLAVGITALRYVLPLDVNFQLIEIREDQVGPDGKGYFDYKTDVHAEGPWTKITSHIEGIGSAVEDIDTIVAGTKGPPYLAGTFTWKIPMRYKINNVDKGKFCTVDHVETMSVSNNSAELKLEKLEADGSVKNP